MNTNAVKSRAAGNVDNVDKKVDSKKRKLWQLCRNTENKGDKRKRNDKTGMCYVNKKNPHSMVEVFPN